jgi:hypothetical protein
MSDGRGLYRKFNVSRVSDPAGKHRECEYFVLDWDHDPYTPYAILEYAKHIRDRQFAGELIAKANAALECTCTNCGCPKNAHHFNDPTTENHWCSGVGCECADYEVRE